LGFLVSQAAPPVGAAPRPRFDGAQIRLSTRVNLDDQRALGHHQLPMTGAAGRM
jgi:hypothetical protein